VPELRPLDDGVLLELVGLREQIGAVAEVGAAVLALAETPEVLAAVAHVGEAPVRVVVSRALPAVVDVPGELEAELGIVGGEVAAVVGRLLRPLRVREGLTRRVAHQVSLCVDRRLTGVLHRGFDELRVRRIHAGLHDLHLEAVEVLDDVGVELVRDQAPDLLAVGGRDDVALLPPGSYRKPRAGERLQPARTRDRGVGRKLPWGPEHSTPARVSARHSAAGVWHALCKTSR
jgi:hypothetical protein